MCSPPAGDAVATIVLYAKDPDAAVQFFVDALGGQDAGYGYQMRSERYVALQGSMLVFRPKEYQKYGWPGGLRGTNPDDQSKPMAVTVRVQVTDVMEAYHACVARGAKEAPRGSGGIYKLVMTKVVRTPEGHLVELYGPLPTTHPDWIKAKQDSEERIRLDRLLGRDGPEGYYFDDEPGNAQAQKRPRGLLRSP